MPTELTRRTFTVDEYHRMGASNIFDDERVELVEGEVVSMAPKGSRHAACVTRLNRLLVGRADDSVLVRVQDPLVLNDITELEPDITLVRSRTDFYSGAHPSPQDTLLVIEVAAHSLAYDREVKLPLYARSGVPEVWLVDLNEQRVTVHTSPSGSDYSRAQPSRAGMKISPALLPRLKIDTDEVLGL